MLTDDLERARHVRAASPNAKVLGPRLGGDVQKVMRAAKAGEWSRTTTAPSTVAGHTLADGEFELALEPARRATPPPPLRGNDAVVDPRHRASPPSSRPRASPATWSALVQQARKDAGLDVTDRIRSRSRCPSPGHGPAPVRGRREHPGAGHDRGLRRRQRVGPHRRGRRPHGQLRPLRDLILRSSTGDTDGKEWGVGRAAPVGGTQDLAQHQQPHPSWPILVLLTRNNETVPLLRSSSVFQPSWASTCLRTLSIQLKSTARRPPIALPGQR